ncbi:hypothetical protein NY2A_b790L [Paramecium bursaria Chlorella virus NY2A]|uniref:Uncharacterized protein b790L n=1 Tax=Paramecium bursaria Chlorella virus NY2A TaxID=46021 RepID=A7IXW5_PBCVN|nr:hypothetical protein NY2A_b790L [Paramecium bursaria Chlorella virus NY2A]ABT15189.1 hypothetical protein NY2A_b790L [Paramecium bursaria Chlorella virus NY2A]
MMVVRFPSKNTTSKNVTFQNLSSDICSLVKTSTTPNKEPEQGVMESVRRRRIFFRKYSMSKFAMETRNTSKHGEIT